MKDPRMTGDRIPPPEAEFDKHEAKTAERRDVAKALAKREAEISGTHPAFNDEAAPKLDEDAASDPDKTPAEGIPIKR